MSEPKTRKGIVVSDFNDAGTGARYKADEEVTLDAGTFANYEHAGLVRKPGADAPKPAAPAA